MAAIGTQFGQNVLADEASFMLVLDGPGDLAGLPDAFATLAAGNAKGRFVVNVA